MRSLPYDKISFGGAFVLISLAAAWVFWQHEQTQRRLAPAGEPHFAEESPILPAISVPALPTVVWKDPVRRGQWSYDAFTPPEIYYNARTKEFTVTPPDMPVEQDAEQAMIETAFGLELISVRPELFPLQLVGFMGGDGNYAGVFENTRTTEHFLARSGWRIPDLGLTIERFEVRRQPLTLVDTMKARTLVATAVVRDEQNGRRTTLTSGVRSLTGQAQAVVQLDGARKTVNPGDVLTSGPTTYKIEQISVSPENIAVMRTAPDLTEPERKTLVPRTLARP